MGLPKRDFKFRAWDKENKKMILPGHNLSKHKGGFEELAISFDNGVMICDHEQYYPSTSEYPIGESYDIMQYTGLKDKNGVEIYEGDILRLQATQIKTIEGVGGEKTYHKKNGGVKKIVKYSCNDKYAGFNLGKNTENREIIGSIYEHSHLLPYNYIR